jgi:ribosome assembly protein YihI (activator of Der GTPase)
MRMRQMTENVAMSSTAKVAILASLNIIDELFTRARQLEELEDSHQTLLSSLSDRIDEVLSSCGSSPEEDGGHASGSAVKGGGSLASIFQSSSSGGDEKD